MDKVELAGIQEYFAEYEKACATNVSDVSPYGYTGNVDFRDYPEALDLGYAKVGNNVIRIVLEGHSLQLTSGKSVLADYAVEPEKFKDASRLLSATFLKHSPHAMIKDLKTIKLPYDKSFVAGKGAKFTVEDVQQYIKSAVLEKMPELVEGYSNAQTLQAKKTREQTCAPVLEAFTQSLEKLYDTMLDAGYEFEDINKTVMDKLTGAYKMRKQAKTNEVTP